MVPQASAVHRVRQNFDKNGVPQESADDVVLGGSVEDVMARVSADDVVSRISADHDFPQESETFLTRTIDNLW